MRNKYLYCVILGIIVSPEFKISVSLIKRGMFGHDNNGVPNFQVIPPIIVVYIGL